MFDAKNTGFDMDWTSKGGPVEHAKAIRNIGTTPVVVDPVPYTLWFPTQIEGRFEGYDFALRQAVHQQVTGTNREVHAGATLFMSVLTIHARGARADVPAITAAAPVPGESVRPIQPIPPIQPGAPTALSPVAAGTGGWTPVPGIGWSSAYAATYQALQKSELKYTSLSAQDAQPATDQAIVLADLRLTTLWNAPADVEFACHENKLVKITVTFKQPPPFADAVADYQKQFGAPVEKRFAAQYETRVARWPAQADRPGITMTESQGIFKILYEAPHR